tara:strand:- start:151 stop:939 length:789 start_codon:yes stop_codon:yes gene_type:complete
MSEEFKKEIKIINKYGAVLKKFAGYMVINEKHLPYKKKDIQEATKMMLVQYLVANQNYDILITGYSQLGSFQKYQNVSSDDMLDPDPKKYLIKSKKHKKILDKANQEQDKLYKEINLLTKVLKEQIKKKLKSKTDMEKRVTAYADDGNEAWFTFQYSPKDVFTLSFSGAGDDAGVWIVKGGTLIAKNTICFLLRNDPKQKLQKLIKKKFMPKYGAGGSINVDPKKTNSSVKGKISNTVLYYFLKTAQDSKNTKDYLKNINSS